MALIDFTKKVAKHCASDLQDGEQLQAAIFAQPAGMISRQIAWGAVGGVVGMAAGEALAKKRRAENPEADDRRGLAADIPVGKAVLAVTDRRFLVFGHSALSGNPKELKHALPIERVAEMVPNPKKLTVGLLIRFDDDSVLDVDAPKTSNPQALVDAFAALRGSS